MKTFALILTLTLGIFGSTIYAQEPNTDIIPPKKDFTDPQFPFPRTGMFRMPTLIDCGAPEFVEKVLENFEEIAVGEGQTFVIRPDGLMQPGPYVFYANPETKTTSLVVKFDPPYGPGIWCIISAGAEFKPAITGDKT